jgi:hypothetical protein
MIRDDIYIIYFLFVSDKSEESWNAFQRKIATEALQWRQYNLFSRQLILRLALRYRDKKVRRYFKQEVI